MSAQVLREAAALMRERAEKVPEQTPISADVMGVWLNSRYYLTTTPAVALAVADWLEVTAERWDTPAAPTLPQRNAALTLAHAYLATPPH